MIFDGFINRIETRFERDMDTGQIREFLNVMASDYSGSTVDLNFETTNHTIPTLSPGSSLALDRRGTAKIAVIVGGVEHYGLEPTHVSIDKSATGGASFGAAVKRSWECPDGLREEAERRADESGVEVIFDVNRVTLKTKRGTLHVDVEPPAGLVGFTPDMCWLTWQVELRDLGLAP